MNGFSSDRDQELVFLLTLFDPFHAMWAASAKAPIVVLENGIHTIH
jgi:hypothetical protein